MINVIIFKWTVIMRAAYRQSAVLKMLQNVLVVLNRCLTLYCHVTDHQKMEVEKCLIGAVKVKTCLKVSLLQKKELIIAFQCSCSCKSCLF